MQAAEGSQIHPAVNRAISLQHLLDWTNQRRGKRFSWSVQREFLSPADGGGGGGCVTVTPDTLDAHRERRGRAERARSGAPVEVRYADIPFERMCTTDIVEGIVRAVARGMHQNYATAKMPPSCIGSPTYFASHAWHNLFVDLVESLSAFLEGAAKAETFIWLDIFAINQDDTGDHFSAMDELDDGKTLAKVIELSHATLVVLDRELLVPFTRLWCLYEIGSTPPQQVATADARLLRNRHRTARVEHRRGECAVFFGG